MTELEHELRKVVEGEVRFDRMTRLLYATDASIYQIEPIGVVFPRHAGDVQAVLEVANRAGVPILPRGAGTSLAGQTVGHAIVLDFSRHMSRVLEVNPEAGWARVQPGVVQDELNAHLRPMGLLFGPDTATSNRATLGGMIGNNSAGSHSIAYGKTIDHVLELDVLLSDGTPAVFRPLAPGELEAKQAGNGLEARIYGEVARIVREQREEVLARYPKLMRRVSGYNLDEFVRDRPFNLAKLVVGSEGTLAAVVEARVRVVPRPPATSLAVVHFHELQEALAASPLILETRPYALEMVDKLILDLAKGSLEHAARRARFVQGDPGAILLVEYAGEGEAEARAQAEALEARTRAGGIGYATVVALDPEAQQNIWKVRKAGQGLLIGMKGERKPIAFVEDTAVAPEQLPEFVRRFKATVERYGTTAGYYGHCSVGCLHIRPLMNLKRAEEVARMRAMAEEIVELVMEFGGALSGEHGDGLARGQWNERLFGPRLYQAFRAIKAAFDPKGLMNPGKIVDSPPMTENLRYGPTYRTWEPSTLLDFSGQGGVAAAVEMCNGVGACRKRLDGAMCPSYMATGDEEHSTRGRANALRAVLSGALPREEFTGRRLHEVLDLCLECKACKAECPANVDMAKLKYEFLAHYHAAHGLPLRNRLFGRIETLNRLGSRLAPLSNWIAGSAPSRWLLERFAGIDRRRPLPPFARQPFTAWFRRHAPSGDGRRGRVALFHDTFVTYNAPAIGIAATRFLEAAGYQVVLPDKRCCGRPLISKGMLGEARAHAAWNVARLLPLVQEGVPVVGLEPSCLLTLRDEYVDLLRSPEAKAVAEASVLFEEFLRREAEAWKGLTFAPGPGRVLLHGHCHQKALAGTAATVAALRRAGYEVGEVDAGCCGMAGAFGFEREHYDLSLAIAARRLVPALRAAGEGVEVCAPGVSCRQQIEHTTGRRARHPAELLWAALRA
ncbi:MAG: FAD-binding protein [Candidatus Rokubacteria bacterium]|nr:FAD-binding protein [Candidatus Rokubacteria bacterium]